MTRPIVEPGTHDEGEAFGRLALVAVAIYMAILLYLMIAAGLWPTLDLVVVGIAVLALLLGRGRLFLRDWIPFLLIFLAWEAMRGLADNFGATVHSDSVIAIERAISFGIVPTVELQRLLYVPGQVSLIDVATSLLYAGHFIFPLGIAFIFWLRDRALYYRFAVTLLAMALVAFVVYLLLPVAPPRFAYRHGEALPVTDIIGATIVNLRLQIGADWVYQNLNPNDNAAFPSLHAAFPTLAFFFVRRRYPRAAWLVALYGLAVWFAILYTGHHYVVDIIGGVAFAVVAYLLVDRAGLLDRLLAFLMELRLPGRAPPRVAELAPMPARSDPDHGAAASRPAAGRGDAGPRRS
jgi:membrane-associated phospholipid phosphatase